MLLVQYILMFTCMRDICGDFEISLKLLLGFINRYKKVTLDYSVARSSG